MTGDRADHRNLCQAPRDLMLGLFRNEEAAVRAASCRECFRFQTLQIRYFAVAHISVEGFAVLDLGCG